MSNVDGKLEWRGPAQQHQHFFHLSAEGEETESCIFNVTLNENKYEIFDSLLQRIANLSIVSFDTDETFNIVMRILQHLGTFKYFETIENRTLNQSFENSFKFLFIDDTGLINIKNEKKMTFCYRKR